jgi:hypothetical protein
MGCQGEMVGAGRRDAADASLRSAEPFGSAQGRLTKAPVPARALSPHESCRLLLPSKLVIEPQD